MAAPSASTFLRQLSAEAKAAEAAAEFRRAQRIIAEQALKDAMHFERPQAVLDELARKVAALDDPPPAPGPRVPDAELDPVAVQVASIGGPRQWAEERMWRELARQEATGEPLADQLARNERAKALTSQRLARLTPEQRQSSLGVVAETAAVRRPRQQEDLERAALAAGLVAAGGGLGYMLAGGKSTASPKAIPNKPIDLRTGPWDDGSAIEGFGDDPASLGRDLSAIAEAVDQMDDGVRVRNAPLFVADYTPEVSIEPDDFGTSDLAAETRSGPAANIAGYDDLPDNDPAVQKAVARMVRAGIPAERALGIATGREAMTAADRQNILYGAK